jgi:hypothetical protein
MRHDVTGLTGRDHRARPPMARIGAVAGVAAVLVAAGLGTTMLLTRPAAPSSGTGPTAQQITVTAAPTIPLSSTQITELTRKRPDYGALADPQRRASCLSGLGYPASAAVLGAQPLQMGDRPAVLLVLAGDGDGDLVALAVEANCSAADTGLIANTRVNGP